MKLPKLPPQVQKIASQVLGFAFVVSSTLFANWLWQKYTTQVESSYEKLEEKQEFLAIMRRVIEETDYNCSSGIGDSKCPFHLVAHNELLCSNSRDSLPKATTDLVREIHRLGGLCNGGRTGRKVSPVAVKEMSLQLRHELLKVTGSEASKAVE